MTRKEAGVTLVELLISITLVALLSTAMLAGLRSGFLSFSKTSERLQDNRRHTNIESIIARQLGNVMPVLGPCGAFFAGDPTSVRLVSSYSMTEGARGLPRIIQLQTVQAENGLRLVITESLYTGPTSLGPFCQQQPSILQTSSSVTNTFIAADGLAYCRFTYRESIPDQILPGGWRPAWGEPNLPNAVRIDMASLRVPPGRLPVAPITVPIHITRDVVAGYQDVQ